MKSRNECGKQILTSPNGGPSHDVFRNVLMALPPSALIDLL